MSYALPGRYFDDFEVGKEDVTVGRTITEGDIALWDTLTGDWHPLHFNEDYAEKKGPFGKRIVYGLVTLAYSSGMHLRMGFGDRTAIAAIGMDNVRMKAPVFIGDTIYTIATVKEKRETKNPGRGVVTFAYSVRKQDETEVASYELSVMFMRKRFVAAKAE